MRDFADFGQLMLETITLLPDHKGIARHSLLILFAFLVVMLGCALFSPAALRKALVLDPLTPATLARIEYFWDTRHYSNLVMKMECVAFYPLWPSLVRLVFAPASHVAAAQSLVLASWLLFLVGIPLLVTAFRRSVKDSQLAWMAVLLFTVNPMGIFRIIGYTEALFAVLSALLMLLLYKKPNRASQAYVLLGIFGLSLLLSLTRPILVQGAVAAFGALVILIAVQTANGPSRTGEGWAARVGTTLGQNRYSVAATAALIVGFGAGYAIYGSYCHATTGEFFRPFTQQSSWGKKVGFQPWLLVLPRSPYEDLLALYFPVILLFLAGILVFCNVQNERPPKCEVHLLPLNRSVMLAAEPTVWFVVHLGRLAFWRRPAPSKLPAEAVSEHEAIAHFSQSYLFWFALFVALAHSALAFLTQQNLGSLARFIFGQPFFFLALAMLATTVEPQKRLLPFKALMAASCLFLVIQWIKFGNDNWLG